MTFYNTDLQYRVTLDTKLNLFIVFDKKDANHFATGITIEQAVQELKKTASSSDVVDAAVYQISQSLEKANDFEFCLEQRKCEIKDAYENPRFV